MEEKEEDSSSWMLGMGIVVTGLILIVSVGATSAGYYGEHMSTESDRSDAVSQVGGAAGPTPM